MTTTDSVASTAQASLVIPSYNRAHLIAETIDSALNQTLPFAEIIVVDDGSTDHTRSVLARFGSRIRTIFTTNQGVQAARNLGIKLSQFEFVALLDSDDLLEPTYLATTLPWMTGHPDIDVLYTNFVTFDSQCQADKSKLELCPFPFTEGAVEDGPMRTRIPDLYTRSLRFQPLFTCGLMLRKAFLGQAGSFSEAFKGVGAEDWEFTLRCICSGQIALCTKALARVRKHDGNDSRSNLHMSMGEVQILRHSLAQHNGASDFEREVLNSIAHRLHQALGSAFDDRNFAAVGQISAQLPSQLSTTEVLKTLIARMPSPLSQWLWRLVQHQKTST
jgi:glycosyltransferase involved in cell wall biosynthesis